MSKRNVYFNLRPGSRERMWDTVENSKFICRPSIPAELVKNPSEKKYQSRLSLVSRAKRYAARFMLNSYNVDRPNSFDLFYGWGSFPRGNEKPYVVEIDNPYSLAYYHKRNFFKNRRKIHRVLDQAQTLVFMSEAAKAHTEYLFDQDWGRKAIVLPPYMPARPVRPPGTIGEDLNFLFVAFDGIGKGGREVLEAFTRMPSTEPIRLTYISDLSDGHAKKYENDPRIKFFSPVSREFLFSQVYPKMDVLLFPSPIESYGVVLLEALSFGLGLVATNAYATAELCRHGDNGVLLEHPFLKPTNFGGRAVINCVDERVERYQEKYLNRDKLDTLVVDQVHLALKESINSADKWQAKSKVHFQNNFAPAVWKGLLASAIS